MVEQTLSISEAQKEITRLPDQFAQEPGTITVTRYGKPVMAILPFEEYKKMQETILKLQETVEALQETIEIMKDDELMASFRRGVHELEDGKGEELDDVLKRLRWE
jgi:prevent-host-death family protein